MLLGQDFESNEELKFRVIGFLEEVIHDPELLTQERKAAANIIRCGAGGAAVPGAGPGSRQPRVALTRDKSWHKVSRTGQAGARQEDPHCGVHPSPLAHQDLSGATGEV